MSSQRWSTRVSAQLRLESEEDNAHLALLSLVETSSPSDSPTTTPPVTPPNSKRKQPTRKSTRNVKAKTYKDEVNLDEAEEDYVDENEKENNGGSSSELRIVRQDVECKYRGCDKSAKGKTKQMCWNHGGQPMCTHISDCDKKTARKGLCTKHGGGKTCTWTGPGGCSLQSKGKGGLCFTHGGGTKCEHKGCKMRARVNRLCGAHGSKCRHKSGCDKRIVARGLCFPHGGGTKCKTKGCPTQAHKKGLCSAHGGESHCKYEGGCVKYRQVKGLCKSHAREMGFKRSEYGR